MDDGIKLPPIPRLEWTELVGLLHQAFGLIANVDGGKWLQQPPEWQAAAWKWRQRYDAQLSKLRLEGSTSCGDG